MSVSIDAQGPHEVCAHGLRHSPGAELHRLALTAMQVGGLEVDVGVSGLIQGPVQQGGPLSCRCLTDAVDLGSGDADLHAQGRHQFIDLAGGNPAHVQLLNDGAAGLIQAAAGFKDRRQEAATTQLGDL